MDTSFTLADAETRSDLTVFVQRAQRVDREAVRLLGAGRVLAVSSPILVPRGILSSGPTILGLRTFALAEDAAFDTVVAPASVLERLARLDALGTALHTIGLPPAEVRASWSGIAAPRDGWARTGSVSAGVLRAGARAGVTEIAAALPDNAGDPIVAGVRMGVWGRELEGAESLPAGVAFAADALGFLGPDDAEELPIFESGSWTRISSLRGHVLVRRAGGGLLVG
ncbi:hypothetical protein D9V32_11070 [Mycetocola tolaasinivorans]|uniref:Uncharacterized protein n=1 Tax=Mycetocola tolaasinivorans TaxID=76635 RepID=A0A3L7A3R7_9MICO|nr:hypothetical protein [Mycetocola tolaasinivorans]RLP74966.1 hypothetical protein D9V32_11070 [Mycetocola tolaasinivorans]